jgi:hypothetical protein
MQVGTVNGLRVHYRVEGVADGAPVVFANSLGTDFRVWDRLLPLLPAGLRVLRYDMRGHGLSDAPEGDYFMGDLVADAAALMEARSAPRRPGATGSRRCAPRALRRSRTACSRSGSRAASTPSGRTSSPAGGTC